MKRVLLIVLDSVGAGALPDRVAATGATLGNLAWATDLRLDHLRAPGPGPHRAASLPGIRGGGRYGGCGEELGQGYTTGHWSWRASGSQPSLCSPSRVSQR